MSKTFDCPHCSRTGLANESALFQHVKAKHGQKQARPLRPAREPSMADLVVQARENRAMGIRNEDWMEEMFGDYLG